MSKSDIIILEHKLIVEIAKMRELFDYQYRKYYPTLKFTRTWSNNYWKYWFKSEKLIEEYQKELERLTRKYT